MKYFQHNNDNDVYKRLSGNSMLYTQFNIYLHWGLHVRLDHVIYWKLEMLLRKQSHNQLLCHL